MQCVAKRDYPVQSGSHKVDWFHKDESYKYVIASGKHIVSGIEFTKTEFRSIFNEVSA